MALTRTAVRNPISSAVEAQIRKGAQAPFLFFEVCFLRFVVLAQKSRSRAAEMPQCSLGADV